MSEIEIQLNNNNNSNCVIEIRNNHIVQAILNFTTNIIKKKPNLINTPTLINSRIQLEILIHTHRQSTITTHLIRSDIFTSQIDQSQLFDTSPLSSIVSKLSVYTLKITETESLFQ